VRLEGHTNSEFRDFNLRMGAQKKDIAELREINRYLEKIGNEYGAQVHKFRDEDADDGLPFPSQFLESEDSYDFGIRLYCIRLSTSIVILLNGARKSALMVKDCKNCYPHFDRARRISKKLNQAILDGYVEIDEEGMEIVIDNDLELSI
jgi:hypothetical protein